MHRCRSLKQPGFLRAENVRGLYDWIRAVMENDNRLGGKRRPKMIREQRHLEQILYTWRSSGSSYFQKYHFGINAGNGLGQKENRGRESSFSLLKSEKDLFDNVYVYKCWDTWWYSKHISVTSLTLGQ